MPVKFSYAFSSADTLSLRVSNVGMQECEPLHSWGPGIRTNYLVHHIVKGKGTFISGGVKYELDAGDTFMIFPDIEISYCADGEEPWEYYWVGFSGLSAAEMTARTDFTLRSPVIHTNFGEHLKKALLRIYEARGEGYAENLRMTGQLLIMFALLIDKASAGPKIKPTSDEYAAAAERFMEYNYALPITVEGIAQRINISRSHLFRVFKEKYAVSPKEYLTALRVKKACDLLKITSLPVGSVANSAGFENHLYFSTAFKKLKGVSPSQYRRKSSV